MTIGRMASAAAAKKCPRLFQRSFGSFPTRRRYASWTRAVACSVWPGFSWARHSSPAAQRLNAQGGQMRMPTVMIVRSVDPLESRTPALTLSPIKFFRNLGRTREIVTILLNHGFGDVVDRLRLMRYMRWWRRVIMRRPEPAPSLTVAQRIRLAI